LQAAQDEVEALSQSHAATSSSTATKAQEAEAKGQTLQVSVTEI
jgi:hypothetical protein